MLGAIQAQDYLSALWAIGLRLPNSTQATVERAIVQKKIVRTWPIRGTLHFVSSADVRWMLGLLAKRAIPDYQKRRGLDEALLEKGRKALVAAFKGHGQLTRDEIGRAFSDAGIPALDKRDIQRQIIRRTAREGLICFGAHRGKQPTFAFLDDWVLKDSTLKREEALAEMAKRYFMGHGPATLKDFVWWSGLKVSDARIGVGMASSQLAQETVDGKTYWMPDHIKEPHDTSPTAYLLPSFDEYLIGYKDRGAMLDALHAQKVVPGNNGMFLPVVLVDGQVVGTWKRTFDRDRVDVKVKPFGRISAERMDAVAVAAERYGMFLGKPVVLEKSQ